MQSTVFNWCGTGKRWRWIKSRCKKSPKSRNEFVFYICARHEAEWLWYKCWWMILFSVDWLGSKWLVAKGRKWTLPQWKTECLMMIRMIWSFRNGITLCWFLGWSCLKLQISEEIWIPWILAVKLFDMDSNKTIRYNWIGVILC